MDREVESRPSARLDERTDGLVQVIAVDELEQVTTHHLVMAKAHEPSRGVARPANQPFAVDDHEPVGRVLGCEGSTIEGRGDLIARIHGPKPPRTDGF